MYFHNVHFSWNHKNILVLSSMTVQCPYTVITHNKYKKLDFKTCIANKENQHTSLFSPLTKLMVPIFIKTHSDLLNGSWSYTFHPTTITTPKHCKTVTDVVVETYQTSCHYDTLVNKIILHNIYFRNVPQIALIQVRSIIVKKKRSQLHLHSVLTKGLTKQLTLTAHW